MNGEIDTPEYRIWIENGIMHLTYKRGVITLDIAEHVVKQRIELTKHIPYPTFVDVREMISIKADARKHLAGPEAVSYISAGAIYLDNYLHYLAGTVFLKIDVPAIPSRLFTNKDKALRWLERFKS